MAEAYWADAPEPTRGAFDKEVVWTGPLIAPVVTWGDEARRTWLRSRGGPHPEEFEGGKVEAARRSHRLHGAGAGGRRADIAIDTVFIGSCTNGRIEDLREVAKVMEGRRVKEGLRAMIVPGSGLCGRRRRPRGSRRS
jgi:3-isopropylmalate/(R)-2-methylmalate dehydratase large subunit